MGRRDAADGPRRPRRDRRRRDPGANGTCFCRPCGRRSPGKAGSLRARSTTSASACPWRPPRRGASPRSTPCSRSLPRRRRSCTSAMTSRAASPAAASSSPSSGRSSRKARVKPSPCLGLCERAPAVLVQTAGEGMKDYAVAPAVAVIEQRRPGRRRRRRPYVEEVPGGARPLPAIGTTTAGRIAPGSPSAPLPRRDPGRTDARRCACSPGWDTSTREASRTTGRTADTRRSRRPSRSGPRASCARPSSRSSSAAAARPSRPAASGRPWRSSPRNRTTSSATPTSPSPARSRTASSWRRIRSPFSRR